jgi:type I restriction enzyme S subunit
MPLPPLDVQKHIADMLDKTQEIIDDHNKQLEELDNLIRATFYKYFSAYFKDNSIYKDIEDCIDFIDYRGKTPEKSDTGVSLITAKNVGFGYFREEPKEYITEELYEIIMTRGFPRANNILFTTEGATLGNVARIPLNYSKFAVGQRLITMLLNKDITPEYLERYMTTQYFQNDVKKKATGSSAQGIRSSELKAIKIPIPPIHLQRKFSNIVTNIEEQKFIVKQSIAESQNLFNSLMGKYFD